MGSSSGRSDAHWLAVADGIYARRHRELDLTLGLVLGDRECLVVDTGLDVAHGREFAAAVRELTPLPWQIVLTHGHYDHCFGTAGFTPCRIWAGAGFVPDSPGEAPRRVDVVPPTDLVTDNTTIDLGGRPVHLIHPGRGHTDHDLLVHTPDAGVVFAGDVVEQGAPPSVGPDAHLAEWPQALDVLLALRPDVVVPGHGEPVDAAFVRRQRDELAGRA